MEVEDRQGIQDALTRCEPGKLGMGVVKSSIDQDGRPVVFLTGHDGAVTLAHMFDTAEGLVLFVGRLSQLGISSFGEQKMDECVEVCARKMAESAVASMNRSRLSN